MVVDPTMTGFNNILAKEENRIGLIFTILIRCRCTEFIWSSDISKLYNQLIMNGQWDCKICMLGSSLWDPVIEEKRGREDLGGEEESK